MARRADLAAIVLSMSAVATTWAHPRLGDDIFLPVQVVQNGPSSWAHWVAVYRTGNADEAVAAVAKWTEAEILANATGTRPDAVDAFAQILLHSEAAAKLYGPNPVNLKTRPGEAHMTRANRLFDDSCTPARFSAISTLRPLCRDWVILTRVPYAVGQRLYLDDAAKLFGDDPLVAVALGHYNEYWMPRSSEAFNGYWAEGDMSPAVHFSSHGQFGREADRAIGKFREAIRLDPELTEAYVRLGRTFWQLDQWNDAEDALAHGLALAQAAADHRWAYLANMFLGALYEETTRPTRAEAAYRSALEQWASPQSARIALGRLLLTQGREQEAWTFLSPMPTASASSILALDPTELYEMGVPSWTMSASLRGLRDRLVEIASK